MDGKRDIHTHGEEERKRRGRKREREKEREIERERKRMRVCQGERIRGPSKTIKERGEKNTGRRKKESCGLMGSDEITVIIMRTFLTDGLTLWTGTMKSSIDNTLSVSFESVKDHSDLTLTFFIRVLQIYL